jgi:predicted MFS family arabinose efflux permease
VLGIGPSIVLGYGIFGAALLLIPLTPGATLLGASLLVAHQLFGDGGDTLFEITQTSLRQRLMSVEILGRVAGSIKFASSAAILVGALVAGSLGEQLGPRTILWLAAGAVIAGAVWLSRSSLMTRASAPEAGA